MNSTTLIMAFFQQMVISMLAHPWIFVATHDYFKKAYLVLQEANKLFKDNGNKGRLRWR